MNESIALVEFSKHSERVWSKLFDYAHTEVGSKIWNPRRFSGIPHETYDRHEDQFFIAYCDELCAGSGRRLDNNELRDLFRACDGAINALVAAYYVGTDVVDARPGIDWAGVEHVLHPQVQAHWNTRCWVTNLHERAWAHTERRPRTPGLDAARALAEREAVAVLGAWVRVLF